MAAKIAGELAVGVAVPGSTKKRWHQVGVLMKSENGSNFILLDRTFNPAGVPIGERGNNSVLIQIFAPNQPKPEGDKSKQEASGSRRQDPPFDDDTHPF